MPLKRTNIGWCDWSGGDLNVAAGCTKISPGCRFCYAEALYQRFGKDFSVVTTYPAKLARLRTAKLTADGGVSFRRGPGSRPLAFPVDMGDLLHPDVPDDFIWQALDTFRERADVDWLVLTKRLDRLGWLQRRQNAPLAPNIWVGATIENQAMAQRRVPELLAIEAAVRFVSFEPLLEFVDLLAAVRAAGAQWGCGGRHSHGQPHLDGTPGRISHHHHDAFCAFPIHWWIVGAESGPQRRAFEVAWAEDLLGQAHRVGAKFFAKQDSGLRPGTPLLLAGQIVREFPDTEVR